MELTQGGDEELPNWAPRLVAGAEVVDSSQVKEMVVSLLML